MEFFIFIIIALVIWSLYKFTRKSNAKTVSESPTITFSVSSGSRDSFSSRDVDTGNIIGSHSGGYVINPNSPLPLTLIGCDKGIAEKLKKLIHPRERWDNIEEITYLFAAHNVSCVELDEYIAKLKTEVNSYIQSELEKHSDSYSNMEQHDKDDYLEELKELAIDKLKEAPSRDNDVEVLLFNEPHDITADDKLLRYFQGNEHLYRFYLYALGRSNKIETVPAKDYYRKKWEELESLGLAKRGKNVDLDILLNTLRMKDINEFYADRLEKKFTRKAQAIEFARNQDDIYDVIAKNMSLRELFQIAAPEDIDIESLKACYAYAGAQVAVILTTYYSCVKTMLALEDAKKESGGEWSINSYDCCRSCNKYKDKEYQRRPKKLPPYHIGCNCTIDYY